MAIIRKIKDGETTIYPRTVSEAIWLNNSTTLKNFFDNVGGVSRVTATLQNLIGPNQISQLEQLGYNITIQDSDEIKYNQLIFNVSGNRITSFRNLNNYSRNDLFAIKLKTNLYSISADDYSTTFEQLMASNPTPVGVPGQYFIYNPCFVNWNIEDLQSQYDYSKYGNLIRDYFSTYSELSDILYPDNIKLMNTFGNFAHGTRPTSVLNPVGGAANIYFSIVDNDTGIGSEEYTLKPEVPTFELIGYTAKEEHPEVSANVGIYW